MIRVKIVPNDIKTVAKIVLIDNGGRVLFLKRSDYMEKYAGEWDLPGGHLKSNENLSVGLKREVEEETGLQISHEHTDFKFFEKKDLDPKEKFQRVALKALEMKR